VEDYGIYNALGGVVTSMTFLTSVLSNASQRFFSVELAKEGDGISRVFSSFLAVYIIISILVIIVMEVGGIWLISNKLTIPANRLNAAYLVFHISLATFIINVLSTPFRALIIAYERMDIYAYISLLEAVGKLVVVYMLYYTSYDRLVTYAILLLLITIANNLFYIFFAVRKIDFRLRFLIDRKVVKSVIGYSSWTLFGTVAGAANMQGNSILFNMFVGPIANAAFAISNQVSSAVQHFSSNFYTAVAPPLTKSFSSGNVGYMNSLFWFSSKAVFFLSFVILIPIFVQTEYILTLWLGEVSPYMVSFVRIILIYSLILSIGNPITTIVQAAGKVKQYHTIVDGFSLLVFPLSYLILKLGYGPVYALICMVIIFAIAHILRLYVLSKTITFSLLKYLKLFVLPCLMIIFICSIVLYSLNLLFFYSGNSIPLLSMFVSFVLSSLLTLYLLFSKEERNRLLSYIKIRGKRD
jgi:O-antigen/teichoic acid export membrane protein